MEEGGKHISDSLLVDKDHVTIWDENNFLSLDNISSISESK